MMDQLEETHKKLNVLIYTEKVAEKTLYNLKVENSLLKQENDTLVRVLAKIKY